MQWIDEAIVLGVKRHGEGSAILEAMTREHGRHLGLVRGAASTRLRPVLQAGNRVGLTWRARLDEHLGNFAVEGLDLASARLLDAAPALYGLTHAAALCRLLPERDPHPQIHAMLDHLIDAFSDVRLAGPRMARFELSMLSELGFGLDLDSCAATGATQDLIYVSPKSGRAVSREAGRPWADKLLRLPAFLHGNQEASASTAADLTDAFAVTGFFLARHAFEPRGLAMPDARASFVTAAVNALAAAPVA
ncbi:MAG TPA: DNA repair protein RecO [Xanthobacteraceae bacterium]|jgi:DNA repair protein RecO (recombination protein O)|nr:DNA repair protein RecO [Xanthobacteraceae bacterium]